MARFILEDLTPEQAERLAIWFCESGEQDLGVWFEDVDFNSPWTDMDHPDGWKVTHEDGSVSVHTKTFDD